MSLVLKNVSKSFGSKKAVNNISLTLDKPGVYPKTVIKNQLLYFAELKGMKKAEAEESRPS